MPRTKERKKFIHKPSTHEVFLCLSSMITWSQILLEHGDVKDYQSFLNELIDKKYFEDIEGKVTIMQVGASVNLSTTKVAKWLHEIYNDILELNYNKEELFINNKIPITFYFKYFDSSGSLTLGMNAVPRKYEAFNIYFMKAQLGCERFWVERVEHEVYDTGTKIFIWLEGSILNRYREIAVEEALYKGWIGFMDHWHLTNSEIDEIIMKHLRR